MTFELNVRPGIRGLTLRITSIAPCGTAPKAVLGIRSGRELPAPHRQQVILLHHTAHFLRLHCKSLPLHQHGHLRYS